MTAFSLNHSELLGNSPQINKVRKLIRAVAKMNENVMILGEVGSGRKFIAKYIHKLRNRQDGPFVTIPCGAIGDTLEADKVWGSTNGKNDYSSLISETANGTVYLSGLDRLQDEYQQKLYNFITTFTSHNSSTLFKARIISSAEPSLKEKIRQREFRAELFKELSAIQIYVPTIRERRQDIPFIFRYFLDMYCSRFSKPFPTIPTDIFEAILDYDWPGNVSELKNCARNLIILSPEGELSAEFLPFQVPQNPVEALETYDLPKAVCEVERFLIRKALMRFDRNQSRAADYLKVSEAALRYKMKKYGI